MRIMFVALSLVGTLLWGYEGGAERGKDPSFILENNPDAMADRSNSDAGGAYRWDGPYYPVPNGPAYPPGYPGYSANTCYAYTWCWNGEPISCWATGNRCTYKWSEGNYVRCTGYNWNGVYGTYYRTCW